MKTLAWLVVLWLGWLIGSSAVGGEVPISELKTRAEQGDANAQAYLALRYLQGNGVEKNPAAAFEWYQKAAKKTNHVALFSLGLMYENGQAVERNTAEALKYYQKAADDGYEVAQRRLAGMYVQGRIVKKDPAEAFKWAHRAAERGDAYDQLLLGEYYATGQGTKKDLVEAYALFKVASSKRPEARTKLSKIEAVMTQEQVATAQKRALELEKRSKR